MPSGCVRRRRHFPVAWPPFFHFAKVFPDQLDNVVLTGRELEVLALLADGRSNKGVAKKLGISARTAEAHREHLSYKLDILTIAGLTKYAITNGLTGL